MVSFRWKSRKLRWCPRIARSPAQNCLHICRLVERSSASGARTLSCYASMLLQRLKMLGLLEAPQSRLAPELPQSRVDDRRGMRGMRGRASVSTSVQLPSCLLAVAACVRRTRCRVPRSASLQLDSLPNWRRLVATADCTAGEVLWREPPLLVWQRGESPEENFLNALRVYNSLPENLQQRISTFHCPEALNLQTGGSFTDDEHRILLILEACCSGLPAGNAGLFEHVAYVNHSCQPNAAIRVLGRESGYELRFIALRSIARGQEITISYIRNSLLMQPVGSRRRHLRSWGFRCECVRCAAVHDDTRQICHGGQMLMASSYNGLLTNTWPAKTYKRMSRQFQQLEGSWWRERFDSRHEQEAAEDARLRRFALGLGPQARFEERGRRLRQGCWMSRTLQLHRRTRDSLHWLAAAVAGDASEAYLWRGQPAQAIQAARERHSFLQAILAGGLSLEAAVALEVQGAALEMLHLEEQAQATFEKALREIEPLHNSWDDDEFFTSYLKGRMLPDGVK